MLSMKEVNKREGNETAFWSNVSGRSSGPNVPWTWTGKKNNNHNTTNGKSYDYGEFKLTDWRFRPVLKTKMAHRVVLYLTFGKEISSEYDVFPLISDDHLDVNPNHLGVRHKKTGIEIPAAQFFAANDNMPVVVALAA